jgi:hypothetical protein
MHETQPQEQSKKIRRSWTLAVSGVGLFLGGLLVGRMLFPLEVPKPFIVERRVEVPVDKVVVKTVEVPLDRRVEVPVEVVRVVEKPVEKIVYQDRIVEKTVFGVPPDIAKWRQLSKGMSRSQVRAILGEPRRVEAISGYFEKWGFGPDATTAYVTFGTSIRFPDTLDKLEGWQEP